METVVSKYQVTDDQIVAEVLENLVLEVIYQECVSEILLNTGESLDEIVIEEDTEYEKFDIEEKQENPDESLIEIEVFNLDTTPNPTPEPEED